eukprot:TRINITY_DN23838_c0_g1_i5.p1 TRINITY_DN23838_c0_g1~~TRINITY_DN23838_c0_g1_i5.p1  ORF type:complete len:1742 (+),score=459.44 TRINITY_DN23838_c0_g1_i5:215-5440(+)
MVVKENAIKPGTETVRELSAKKLRELAGRDLSMAKYPLYCYFDEPRFQMTNLVGIEAINSEALKELSVSNCNLSKLGEEIDMFVRLKRLWAANNNIRKVRLSFAHLEVLDLSKNGLFEFPDLEACPNLKELDISKNKIRGVWLSLLHNRKLEVINLQRNKLKWGKEDEWPKSLGIMQNWPKLRELNFMGNKLNKTEGYRYYLAAYSSGLKLLDGVESEGDADEKFRPPNPIKVKPLSEVLKFWELRQKVMANPDLFKKPKIPKDSQADEDGADPEGVEGLAAEGEETDPEDQGPFVRVLMSDLTNRLSGCFEGPKEAQTVMTQLLRAVKRLVAASPEHRIIFEKETEAVEVIEDFLQTMVVVAERTDSVIQEALTILITMLSLSNKNIGLRCLIQLKDLLLSSAKYGDVGVPLLLDLVVPQILDPAKPVEERDLLVEALYQIEHPNVTAGLEPVVTFLCDILKSDVLETSDSVMGLLGSAARDESLCVILRKEKIMSVIADILKEATRQQAVAAGKGKEKSAGKKGPEISEEVLERLALRFTHSLDIVAGMARNDVLAAEQYVKKNIHIELLSKMNSLLMDAEALRKETTWLTIGEIITCVSALCNDPKALQQAMEKKFLDQLVVILQQDGLPCSVIAASYRSLSLILRFSVPDDPTLGIDNELDLSQAAKAKKKRAAIRAAAEADDSNEDWMQVRLQINEVLGGVVPLLPYLGGTLYNKLCRKQLGSIVPLYLLTDPNVSEVLASVVDLISFYGERAKEYEVMEELDDDVDEDSVPEQDRVFKTYVLDANAAEICSQLDDADRDNLLFALLEVQNDDVKLGAVETLKTVPLSNFDTAEVQKLIKLIADVDDPSAGRTEEVLTGLFAILTKFAGLPPTHRQSIEFRKKFSRSIFVVLEVLSKICANDARSSQSDLAQKETLCNAAIEFLQTCTLWREGPQMMSSRDAIGYMKEILANEDRFGDEARPARVEATGVGGSVQSLLKVYDEQVLTGTVAARILNRISELMEGPAGADGYQIEVEASQSASTWQKVVLTSSNDPKPVQEKRFDEQKRFFAMDGFKSVLAGLIKEERRVRKLEPRDLVALGFEEAERLDKLKNDELMEDEDDQAGAAGEAKEEDAEEEEEEEEMEEDDLGEDDDDEDMVMDHLTQPWQKCGGLLGKEAGLPRPLREVPTCRTFAAFVRLSISLLWYGEKDKQEAVRLKLRELRVFQAVAFEAMKAGHFKYNIGAKVAMLMQELLEIPANQCDEDPKSILLYEVAVKFMLDAFKSYEKRLDKGVMLTRREECLMMRLTSLWSMLSKQVGAVNFSEDEAIDRICDKFVGTYLFPIEAVNVLLLWLYYDISLSRSDEGWQQQSMYFRETIRIYTKVIVAAFLENSPDYQFEILVHINTLSVKFGLDLRPSYLCEMLHTAEHLQYQFAIAQYIYKMGWSGSCERVRRFNWFWQGGVQDPPRRLVVCTHNMIYVLRNSYYPACSVCTPDKFCPDGPVLMHEIRYENVLEVLRGFGGNMFRLVYEAKGAVYSTEETLDFITDVDGVVDDMIETIISGVPQSSQVELMYDAMTWLQLSRKINNGESRVDRIENMVFKYNTVQTKRGKRHKKTKEISMEDEWKLRSIVLTTDVPLEWQLTSDGCSSTSSLQLKQFIVFKEDYREWQAKELLSNQPSDDFLTVKAEIDAGSVEISNLPVEEPVLRLYSGDDVTDVQFGSSETLKEWIRVIHTYTEGGFASKDPLKSKDGAGKKKK